VPDEPGAQLVGPDEEVRGEAASSGSVDVLLPVVDEQDLGRRQRELAEEPGEEGRLGLAHPEVAGRQHTFEASRERPVASSSIQSG
jgi:hypothetical protein